MAKSTVDDDAFVAMFQEKGARQTARSLGINERAVYRRRRRIEARRGEIPSGTDVHGTSTLYDADGNVVLNWVKRKHDNQERLLKETAEILKHDLPQLPRRKENKKYINHLMAVYPMGDPHCGMYSYAAETGQDFDLNIFERDLLGAMDHLVRSAPACDRAIIINLGDWFHADNLEGITTKSGNILDMDTRMSKVVRVGVNTLRRCIESALTKHRTVELINSIGNHDTMLSIVLSVMFMHIYEKEPRVIIHDQPTPRHYIQHGKVLIGTVHGDKTKDPLLPGIMAAERPELWGQTRHRYFYRGHHHHDDRKEYNGCIVEQFRTLAAHDAYAAGRGFLAGRDMKCIVHHKEYGEVSRQTCSIDMLK